MADYYEYRHLVTPEETDFSGATDYENFLCWQEYCQDLFLGELGPEVLVGQHGEVHLLTLQMECELFAEVSVFDELSIRMWAAGTGHTELSLRFDYVRVTDGEEMVVARGGQRIACMYGPESSALPALIPDALARALALYAVPKWPLAGRQS